MIKLSAENKRDIGKLNGVGLCHSGTYHKNRERFLFVLEENGRKKRSVIVRLAGLFLLLAMLASTYLVQIQAEYPAPESVAATDIIPENTYLFDNGDGTFAIVHETEVLMVTDDRKDVEELIEEGFQVIQGER